MVPKKKIYIGAQMVENNPEEPVSTPYRGRVREIHETGKGETDYYVFIRPDDESMKQPRVALYCPGGIMSCFPQAIDLEKNRKETLEKNRPFHRRKVPDLNRSNQSSLNPE